MHGHSFLEANFERTKISGCVSFSMPHTTSKLFSFPFFTVLHYSLAQQILLGSATQHTGTKETIKHKIWSQFVHKSMIYTLTNVAHSNKALICLQFLL